MRLLLALLALLTGLAMPQAASALTTGRVDSGVVASQTIAPCAARSEARMAQIPADKVKRPAPSTIWLPTVALVAPFTVFHGDRARE